MAKKNSLKHATGCPADRIETTRYEIEQLVTNHCLDCAAHEAVTLDGEVLPPPSATGPFAGTGRRWDSGVNYEQAGA